MFKRILVPLDSSLVAEQVLPLVRALSERLKLPVRLISVVETQGFLTSVDRAQRFDELVEEVMQASREYLETTSGHMQGLSVDWAVEQGNTAEAIIEIAAADNANLIAMATHGRSGIARWMLGSVAEKVLRATSNPLLLVRATESGQAGELPLDSIIVPLDGSQLAESILPIAAGLARSLDIELVLAQAVEIPATAYYRTEDSGTANRYLPTYDQVRAAETEKARTYLDARIGELRRDGTNKARPEVLTGSTSEEIIKLANRTRGSLIAMCTHGRSGVARWVLGSVAEKVIHHCSSPVLVLRPGA